MRIATDVIPKVRALLRDTASAVIHYSDATIANGAVDALRELNALRPSTRYVGGALTDLEIPADVQQLLAKDFAVDDRYVLGIVYYAASRCWENDVTDTVNMQLANAFREKAVQAFTR